MTADDWARIKEIVGECLERPPSERRRYIEEACRGETVITREVEDLIASMSDAGDFLETSIVDQDVPEDLNAGEQIGLYQVIELIGRGGMGSVYRAARASDFQKEVAVKVVKRGMDTAVLLRRFRQERQILAALDHPNIARLIDGGATADGRPYIVMELITGRPITEYAAAEALSIEKRLRLFQTVCSAVQHAHQNLIVHRDLKPGNVLVTPDGAPKLLDFGIAKLLAADGERTAPVVRFMTPECASPEQVRGDPLSTLTDIYSLGVLLYELLTGRKPYKISSGYPAELQLVVCEQDPVRPSKIQTLPSELDHIVLKAMHKDPSQRYVSAAQLSEDIGRYLSALPVIARPDTLRYRAGKFIARNLVACVAAIVVVAALAAGLGFSLWEAHLARLQRERAERRFTDVRQLANALLFDVHDAIQDLPGATPARKLIVDRALKYLDRLAHEEDRDPALEDELAAAYLKVGDVQGGFAANNLGDMAGAMASFERALAIRKALAAAHPADLDARRRLAQAYQFVASQRIGLGQIVEASQATRQMLAVSQAIYEDPHHVPQDKLSLSYDYEAVGDLFSPNGYTASLNDERAALEYHRKALEIDTAAPVEDSAIGQIVRANQQLKIAMDLSRIGELPQARGLFLTAIRLFDAHPEDSTARTNRAVAEEKVGNTYLYSGEFGTALDYYRRSHERLASYAAQDPKNVQLRLMESGSAAHVGYATAKLGSMADGLTKMQYCETIVRTGLAQDSANSELRGGIGLLLTWFADVHRAVGNKSVALNRARQATQVFRSIIDSTPEDDGARKKLASAWNIVGNLQVEQNALDDARKSFQEALTLAEKSKRPDRLSESAKYAFADAYGGLCALASRSGSVTEALEWCRKSSSIWQQIAHPLQFTPDGLPSSGKSRVQKELARLEAIQKKSLRP